MCLVAVVAMSAVVAASASAAAPEYLICGKAAKVENKYTGTYSDKTCSTKVVSGGEYELESYTHAKSLKFKATSGPSALYVYIPGTGKAGETTCAKSKTAGEVTGAKTETSVVTFEKCTSEGKTCTGVQAGTKKGDIVTYTLDFTLFATGSSKTGVANEAKAPIDAQFECEGLKVKTTGAVSGEVTGDVGVASKTSSLVDAVTKEGAPDIASSEPLLTEITGVGTLPSGEEITANIKGEAFYVSV
jgi:hypothetical protein